MEKWKKCLIHKEKSIYDAAEIINQSGIQIALVVDEKQGLLGTVTDGDIRRAIIARKNLELPVEDIMNRTPITITKNHNPAEIRRLMREKRLHDIPITDDGGVVCGLISFSELICSEKKNNAVVLMAGGLGSRLQPLTNQCPKPLLKIGNKPILQTIIENFIEYGFYRFYISVNYKSEMIEEFFGDGSRFGINIEYLREDKKLGTAGALSLLTEQEKEPIIVMNGDILTKVDFEALLHYHEEEQVEATMAVREYTIQIPYGVIEADGNIITQIREKPEYTSLVNAGIYVLSHNVVNKICEQEYLDMTTIFSELIKQKKKTTVFPISEYWRDIGKMDDFERAQIDYSEFFE